MYLIEGLQQLPGTERLQSYAQTPLVHVQQHHWPEPGPPHVAMSPYTSASKVTAKGLFLLSPAVKLDATSCGCAWMHQVTPEGLS